MWQSVDGGKPGAFGTSPCQAGRGECLVLIPPGPQTPALTTYAGLAALPRPPTALLSYLQRHNTCPALARPGGRPARASTGSDEWEMLTALLGNNLVLPPGLGKALFEAAARIPGSAVLPAVADAAGGGGIAVARNDTPSLRTELIFAPRSYRFIGVQDVITRRDGGLRPGAVWAAASLRAARVVNTAPVTSLSQVVPGRDLRVHPRLLHHRELRLRFLRRVGLLGAGRGLRHRVLLVRLQRVLGRVTARSPVNGVCGRGEWPGVRAW